MTTTERERVRRGEGIELDLEGEDEVDLRRYGERVAMRWWLPVAGLVLGLIAGYLLSFGGAEVYRAQATLYLGQPFSPTATTPVQGLATNPNNVGQIARSEDAIAEASEASGVPVRELRGNVSAGTATGAAAGRVVGLGAPLMQVTVRGGRRTGVQLAANALAQYVVREIGAYVDVKIREYRRQLEVLNAALTSLQKRIAGYDRALGAARGVSPLERLTLISQADNAEQRRAQVEQDRLNTRGLLALAEKIEKPQVVTPARAAETTARGPRNSMAVGGLLGLILGALAALVWDRASSRGERRAV